jgi:hypothetical protein
LLGVLALGADQKLTPERLVQLHLDEALRGWQLPSGSEREIRGECATTTPAGAIGTAVGPFRFVSSAASSRLTVTFGGELYEGESFAADGQQVQIGFAQPRTSSRSALGIFLDTNPVVVGEGLLGGALNARWPLADLQSRQPKLGYDGVKKLDGRPLHRLRYRARQRQGSLEIALYLDPETYRHVASVYTLSQAQGMGLTPESSSQQSEIHYRLEEWFSDFDRVGALTLPKTWVVRYSRSGNTTSEWKYEFKLHTAEEHPRAGGAISR